jgi:hypothetical protein
VGSSAKCGWGGSRRQASLARFLPAVEIASLDGDLGKRVGVLLARSRTTDVVDAALVLLSADGDVVLTSDADDVAHLAAAAGLHIDVVHV